MFWRKKKAPPAESTFKERVENFWEWWAANEQRFFDTIEAGKCGDLQPEVSSQINRLHESFAWVFGPPPEGKAGHSFTLSGEGNTHFQFLAYHWQKRAPEFQNWTFHAARQPGSVNPALEIEIHGKSFEFGKLWITPKIDKENEKVDIMAWHPVFEQVEEKTCGFVLYLMLDEVLGEFGTDMWLGSIEQGDTQLTEAFPVTELRDFIHDLEIELGWKKYPPTECYTGFQMKNPDGRFLRSDIFAGTSANMRLVQDYHRNEGNWEDPIAKTGADYVFVTFDRDILPKGEEVDFRGDIEDAISSRLEESHRGRLLGGATGLNNAYIDILIYDEDRSLEEIRDVLIEQELPSGTGIHYFAKGNEGKRIII